MRFSLTQELRQEQRQLLTQRMIQSMEILQLTLQQLEQRINEELEQNPLLELETDEQTEEDSGSETEAETENEEQEPEFRIESETDDPSAFEEFSIADDFAQNYSDTIDESPVRSQNWLEDQEAYRADIFANVASPEESFQNHLLSQLDWQELSVPLHEMAVRIINNLDSNGYFPYGLPEFLGDDASDEELSLAKKALALVQHLEPAGTAGKDLKECLLLQIDPQSRYAGIQRTLIKSFLEYIAENRIPAIAWQMGMSSDLIQSAVLELRSFNPRPSAGFGGETAPSIVPDIFVEKDESGKFIVRLEEGRSPQLRLNKQYRRLLSNRETDKEAKIFIRQKVGSALWLIDAIEQRRNTILKVSQTVIDHQSNFFEYGQQALKPLKMQQIADVLGIHVTTVSRACEDKWVASEQGVFPIRRLFTSGVTAFGSSENVANDVVRLKLQEIIDNEDKNEPLSDDAIVKQLEAAGIQLARRTVVKYRQSMNIPSSHRRRHWKS